MEKGEGLGLEWEKGGRVKDGGRVKKEGLRVGEIGEGLRVWKRGRVKGRKKGEGLRVRKVERVKDGEKG